MEVPVGEALIGRVVNPLGQPVDGLGDIETTATRQWKHLHQALCNVNQFLNHSKQVLKRLTLWFQLDVVNVKLIIGDRQTGKTSVAIDAILNQKDKI